MTKRSPQHINWPVNLKYRKYNFQNFINQELLNLIAIYPSISFKHGCMEEARELISSPRTLTVFVGGTFPHD
jgi:hypothetical protein